MPSSVSAAVAGKMTALRAVEHQDLGVVGTSATTPRALPISPVSGERAPESVPLPLNLALVLQVLGDPIRLEIVKQLADGTELSCGDFELPVSKPTCSHHLRVLRECGLIETRTDGKARLNRLRREALEVQLPGLLAVILKATE